MQSTVRLIVLLAALTLLSSCQPKAPAPVPAQPSPQATVAKTGERTLDEVALLEAAIKGDAARVKSLLDRGVNPNAKDPEGRTPLTEAAFYGHTEIAKALLSHGADLYAKKNDGQTPLSIAAGHKDIAEMFARETQLLVAAGKGDNNAVKKLMDEGAEMNVRDPDGRTPLTEAVWGNHIATVKLLLDKGADPNARKTDGATPMSIAAGKGYKEIVELLKKAGAK
jgi:ankyrin repeat protein